jgi:hypothetical protein
MENSNFCFKRQRNDLASFLYTVIRESFLNRQMGHYVLSLVWRKGYYGAYRTPDILRPFLFFFIFFSSFTYERIYTYKSIL